MRIQETNNCQYSRAVERQGHSIEGKICYCVIIKDQGSTVSTQLTDENQVSVLTWTATAHRDLLLQDTEENQFNQYIYI